MKNSCIGDYLKMSQDVNAPILYTTVLGLPDGSNDLEKFCAFHQTKLIDIASKNGGIVYSICDTSGLQPYSFDLLINYYFKYSSKSKEIFQTYKIFVLPKLGVSVDISEVFKLTTRSSIYFFDTLDEAKASVFEDWASLNKSSLIV